MFLWFHPLSTCPKGKVKNMKIKILKEYSFPLEEKEIKEVLDLFDCKSDFLYKTFKEGKIIEIKFKDKIEKNLKNLISAIIKGMNYNKFLIKNNIFFKCFLIGVDSIVLPSESIKLEQLLKSKEIIPHNGLKEGINTYLKIKKTENIKYILIDNLNEKYAKKFSISFLKCLIKNYSAFSFEIEKYNNHTNYFLSFKTNDLVFPLEGFGLFLENLGKIIYIEKVLRDGV